MTPYRTIAQQSASYPVFIARGAIDGVGGIVSSAAGARKRPFVITSANLLEPFGRPVAASFDPPARIVLIEEGERRKTLETAAAAVTALLEAGAQRDSVAVVVGGGMIGDTAGFAASIFLRGIDLVHVPTTLLAQVDSSIGGKVAVNHPAGKNLVGSFHAPRAVVADIDALATLPERELLSGVFEALKSGIIGDPALFELTEQRRAAILERLPEVLEEVVRRSVDVKGEIVSADEREGDVRRLLNYGHTIGHGIEAATHYEGMTHGEAVGWGMIAANAIAVRRGMLPGHVARRIDDSIAAFRPTPPPSLDREAVLRAMAHDKKFSGGRRVMILPRAIGLCEVVDDIESAELEYGIDAVTAR
jgi:3-dehydroquinate synthase